MTTQYAVMILSCEQHASTITQMLDITGVSNWILLPALQARRMGYLQNVPRHRHGSTALFGFGDGDTIIRALQALAQAEQNQEICPDCVVLMWKVQQTQMANVALDPVCEEVVDRELALSTIYAGTSFFFCSQACLDRFSEQPAIFVERTNMEQRVGRRTVAPCTCKQETTNASQQRRKPRKRSVVAGKVATHNGNRAKGGRSL